MWVWSVYLLFWRLRRRENDTAGLVGGGGFLGWISLRGYMWVSSMFLSAYRYYLIIRVLSYWVLVRDMCGGF